MSSAAADTLVRPDGSVIAYRHLAGSTPGILFLAGFNSNMQGIKALALEQWCRETGRQYTRFDYFGHGESTGAVEDGCIGRWRADAAAVLDRVTSGPQLLVGSSMGGWIALLLALDRPTRVHALLGLAAAPDFTRRLQAGLTPPQRAQLEREGFADLPNCYDDGQPYRIGAKLLEEAVDHLLLDTEIPLDIPVRLIHGQCDEDVPWTLSLTLAEKLRSGDVEVQLVKSADHRLSEPADIDRLRATVMRLLGV